MRGVVGCCACPELWRANGRKRPALQPARKKERGFLPALKHFQFGLDPGDLASAPEGSVQTAPLTCSPPTTWTEYENAIFLRLLVLAADKIAFRVKWNDCHAGSRALHNAVGQVPK